MEEELPTAVLPDEKERLERQIHATDRQIDRLVYELYGLTEEEIKIVEGSGINAQRFQDHDDDPIQIIHDIIIPEPQHP